jgi:hypothetical protein
MKRYLSYNSFPELAGLSEQKAKEIWEKCHSKRWRYWQTWFGIFVFCLCAVLGTEAGIKYGGTWGRVLGPGIGCIIGYVLLTESLVLGIRIHIREYLISHGKTN